MDGVSGKISERAVTFGPHGGLVGIVTEPLVPAPRLPAVVALNGGILLRSGQGRIYVSLARRLSARGYRVLRFDLSGIGDSSSRGDGLPPVEAAVADVREALDWFVGANRAAVLLGLCDGATLAAYQASIDRRVVGVMLIDPLIPRTPRYRRLHLWRRLVHHRTWFELANGSHPFWRILKKRTKAIATGEDQPGQFDPNDPPIQAALQAAYQGLVDNEVETFAIFTGGMQHRHCYREQLLEAFPAIHFTERLRLEYFESNDHHLEWPPHRAWLLDTIETWLTSAPFRESIELAPLSPSASERASKRIEV